MSLIVGALQKGALTGTVRNPEKDPNRSKVAGRDQGTTRTNSADANIEALDDNNSNNNNNNNNNNINNDDNNNINNNNINNINNNLERLRIEGTGLIQNLSCANP